MKLNELSFPAGERHSKKRKGRGLGSGLGKTAGRGTKGQRARSGGFHKVGFEGGQMPLQRRLPKRGFKNPFRKEFSLVKVGDLSRFEPNTEVNFILLKESGVLKKILDGVKLLADGEIDRPLTIVVDKASKAAIAKVEAAGGRVLLPPSEEGEGV